MDDALTDARSIKLKGRSFLAVVLSPDLPFDDWLRKLDDLAARSAGFFLERPVVLDVSDLSIDKKQLKGLLADLAARNVRIMGIEGARPSQIEAGMPPAMKGGRPAADVEVPNREASETETAAMAEPASPSAAAPIIQVADSRPSAPSVVIREPVRSGQSVIFPEGDITILGSVASGAEVIAGGSVHVYGALRGRVMAGSLGNGSARIFCRRLEAELLSIDGIYTTADELSADLQGQPVHLWLDGDEIKAQRLT
ncbi:MAG: septum site-determining protein MinC [Rhizobiaceae bacterium]|nr:septum site-determining protein MinC [Rhizobiaceae bacterium]